MLIEVTSIDFGTKKEIFVTENKIISKLRKAVGHIAEKDTDEFQNYYKGGVIFYTSLFNFLSKFGDLIQNTKFIKTTKIFEKIDFIVFIPEPAFINNKSSRELQPPVFYVKNRAIFKLFKRKLNDKNYKINFISDY